MALGSRKKYHQADPKPAGNAPADKAALKSFQNRAVELAEPALAGLGLELVQAQCLMEGGRPVLRLFIDRLEQAGGEEEASQVSLDDCAAASRLMDDILEADDREQPDGYVLELSSPGLDRPLLREADYFRFQGRLVKLKLRREKVNSSHKGRLTLTENGALALETAEGLVDFTIDQVVSCRLSLDEIAF